MYQTEIVSLNDLVSEQHMYRKFAQMWQLKTIAEHLPDLSKAIIISKKFMTNWERIYRKDLCINTEKLLKNMSML